ncbi:MAG: hypothetical protein AAFQ79_04505 [Pseudomonadota bacterium]
MPVSFLTGQIVWVLQAMAQRPDVLIELYPDTVNAAVELGDDWLDAYDIAEHQQLLIGSDIEEIDAFVRARIGNPQFWKQDALAGHADWQYLRTQARQALEARGLATEKPDRSKNEYIFGPPSPD